MNLCNLNNRKIQNLLNERDKLAQIQLVIYYQKQLVIYSNQGYSYSIDTYITNFINNLMKI